MRTIRRALAAITVATSAIAGIATATPAHAVVQPGNEIVQFGWNGSGQTGDGTPIGTRWAQISAGGRHTIALRNDGTVWAWGYNVFGELGDGTFTQSSAPVQVKGPGGTGFLTGITQISAGNYQSLARRSDGTVWAWGSNGYGELGNILPGSAATPVQVQGAGGVGVLTGITQISAGGYHSLARRSDGTVWAWGSNFYGQLGDGAFAQRNTPVQVLGVGGVGFLTGITQISAGNYQSLARRSDGTVWAWGNNGSGELGNNTFTSSSSSPVQVVGASGSGALTGITQISAGNNHSLARRNDGTVWAWGYNGYGQLGNNTTTTSRTPVQVQGLGGVGALTGITQISGGDSHSIARRSDGTVWGWGYNLNGELGDGTTTSRSTPVQTIGVTRASAVEAGYFHTGILRAPSLTTTTNTLAFGTVRTNTTISTPITITNSDTVAVTVAAITTTGTDAAAFDPSGPVTPAVLTPGQSITVVVTATTNATARTYSAQLVVDTDQPEPLVLPITLTAVDPAWTFGPAVPTFPTTSVGDTVTSAVVPVSNTGLVGVAVSAVTITGVNAADFVVAANTCAGVLAPAASCSMAVTFAPKSAGSKTATLSVVSDAGTKTLALAAVAKNPADLNVVLTTPGTGTAGVAFTSTANIANIGPSAAKTVTATVTISTGGTFTSVSGTGWSCSALSSTQRRCARGFISSGAAANLTITATFPAGAASISVILDASSTIDVDPTDNVGYRTITVV